MKVASVPKIPRGTFKVRSIVLIGLGDSSDAEREASVTQHVTRKPSACDSAHEQKARRHKID